MNQEMIWQDITQEQYRAQEKQVRRLPLLQSSDYAAALRGFYGYEVYPVLLHFDKKKNAEDSVALCQIITKSALGGALQAIMCDQGPVFFENQKTSENFDIFVNLFNKKYPRRIGRKRRFIPNIEKTHEGFIQNKFKKTRDAYETIWMDLTQNEEVLRASLKKNWRGSLSKAEKSELTLEWDSTGKRFPWLLKVYEIDKKQRNYSGPSVSFMKALGHECVGVGNLLIGRAMLGNECVASILILIHGQSATYQIGWNGEQGRKNGAHHLLLWNALNVLKQRGIKDFDLGGINDDSAKNVAQFKKGMGGAIMCLPGIYT